jgi:hypothetical protein
MILRSEGAQRKHLPASADAGTALLTNRFQTLHVWLPSGGVSDAWKQMFQTAF